MYCMDIVFFVDDAVRLSCAFYNKLTYLLTLQTAASKTKAGRGPALLTGDANMHTVMYRVGQKRGHRLKKFFHWKIPW